MIRVLALVFALATPTFGQNTQWPCPGVFMYEAPEPNMEPGRWYGVVHLSTDTTLDLVSLNIMLDNKADILGIWLGELTTDDNKEFKIKIKNITLTPRSPLAVRFFVQYKTQKKIPRLRTITMNGREICDVNRPQLAVSSPIRPDETSPTRLIGGQPVADIKSGGEVTESRSSTIQMAPAPSSQAPPSQAPPSQAPPSQAPVLRDASTTKTDQYGRVVVAAPPPLIVNGSPTLQGQWPWQIALEAQIRVFVPVFPLAVPAFGQYTQWPYPGVFMYEPPPPPPLIGGQPVADINSSGEVTEARSSGIQLAPAPPPQEPAPSPQEPAPPPQEPAPPLQEPAPRPQGPAPRDASTTKTDQCGRVVVAAPLPLIVNGSSTLEGQWPWQIALYEANAVNNKYNCGGTLVSPRHVITAAHCVPRNNSQGVANKNTFTVYLGKHNLRTSIKGVQVKLVEKIIVHPEYNMTTNSHDVAILELTEPVSYTDWVQPACLWPEDQIDLTNVIGKIGLVPGWGINDKGFNTEQLSMVKMPVVDTETCIRSNTEFFVTSTSEYTYCAGYRDGSSVCNGDSGGGMVFRIGDSWYLRGLVSRTVVKKNELVCDPTHYTVFTDLAKLLPWIKRIVTDL